MPCIFKPDMHHPWLCIKPCLRLCVYHVVCFFPVASLVSFGFVPELWGFVRRRAFVFFMDSFFFLAGSQARWPYPRNHFYLCLLVALSFAMPRYLPLAISCLPYCHVKPLTHLVLANRCLAMLPLLLSPSYSVASCRWGLEFVPCWNMEMLFLVGTCLLVGISQYILFN